MFTFVLYFFTFYSFNNAYVFALMLYNEDSIVIISPPREGCEVLISFIHQKSGSNKITIVISMSVCLSVCPLA